MSVGSFGILGNNKNNEEKDKKLRRDLRKTIKLGDITLSQVSDILCERHYSSNPDSCFIVCILGRNNICNRLTINLDELARQKEMRLSNPFYNKGE